MRSILLTQEYIILSVYTYFCCLKADCIRLANILRPSTKARCDLLSNAWHDILKAEFLRQHHYGGFGGQRLSKVAARRCSTSESVAVGFCCFFFLFLLNESD